MYMVVMIGDSKFLMYKNIFFQDELGEGETMETGEEPESQEMAVVLHEVSYLQILETFYELRFHP